MEQRVAVRIWEHGAVPGDLAPVLQLDDDGLDPVPHGDPRAADHAGPLIHGAGDVHQGASYAVVPAE